VVSSAARRAGEIFPPAAAPTSEHRRIGLQVSESRDLRPPLGLDGYKPRGNHLRTMRVGHPQVE
jgi:hypothetical protein